MSTTCQRCTTRTDLYLCRDCTARLRRWLADTHNLMNCLETVVARQNRFAETVGPRSATRPLFYNPQAADARRQLAATLVSAAHELATRRGAVPVLPGVPRLHLQPVPRDHQPDAEPNPDPGAVLPLSRAGIAGVAAAAWLHHHTDWLRGDPSAGDVFNRIERAVIDAEHACVPPAPRWYAGPCDHCHHDLLAEADTHGHPRFDTITCEHCGTRHDVEGRHEYLIRQARLQHITATTALSWTHMLLGKRIPRGTWDSWVARRRITPRDIDRDGHPLYRFGDVERLARDHIAKPRRKAS